jgi:methionyl-tRNA formyltransferase
MKTFSNLVYFGSDEFSASILSQLLHHDWFKSNLKYVVTKTPAPKGRKHAVTPTVVETIASQQPGVTILHANTRSELDDVIKPLPDPLVGVLVSYGVIVSNFVLSRFDPGIINFHPSLLPKYRGPSPVESAILAGEHETGVSVMQLAEKMDAGPVYAQKTVPLAGHETSPELYKTIVEQCADWFSDQLQAIFDGQLQPQNQDDSQATYTRIIKKQDGHLHPETQTAQQCERQIRAYIEFPKSRVQIDDQDLIVTKAHVVAQKEEAPLVLPCVNKTMLSIDELIAPSGKTMSADAYLRGKR